jgi:hypothetical protein
MVPYQMMPNLTGQPHPNQFAFALPVAYWPHSNLLIPNMDSHIHQQNPNSGWEDMNNRNRGHLAQFYPHLTPCAQVPNVSHHIVEKQNCLPVGKFWLAISHFMIPLLHLNLED